MAIPKINDKTRREESNHHTENTTVKKDNAGLYVDEDKSKNKVAIIGILVLVLSIIAGAVWFFFFKSDDKEEPVVKVEDKSTVAPAKDTNDPFAGEKTVENFWHIEGYEYPVKLEEWQLTPHDAKEVEGVDNLREYKSSYFLNLPGLFSASNILPALEAGYTDNLDEAVDENGLPTMMYAYWTREGFTYFVGDYLERVINPTYGKWTQYQDPTVQDFIDDPNGVRGLFKDKYDPEYYVAQADTPAKEWVPVYADWDRNNYGLEKELLDTTDSRWVGEVDFVDVTFNYNDKEGGYDSANIVAEVTYKAWTVDEEVVTRNGLISFDVVKGVDEERYLIKNSKLEMKL